MSSLGGGAAFFRPSHCPSLGEGSVRDEKMLGWCKGLSRLGRGGFRGIGSRSVVRARSSPYRQKNVSELDKCVIIEGHLAPYVLVSPQTGSLHWNHADFAGASSGEIQVKTQFPSSTFRVVLVIPHAVIAAWILLESNWSFSPTGLPLRQKAPANRRTLPRRNIFAWP